MPYLTKELPNGHKVGITNCEIVLPVSALEGLDDPTISALVRELAGDLMFLENHLGSGQFEYGTIQEARAYVVSQQQKKLTQAVKKDLTQKRRREFNSRRAQLMLALIERDGYNCQYPECGSQEDLTIDHVVPLSKGGSDVPSNLRLLCRKHNSVKGDTIEFES